MSSGGGRLAGVFPVGPGRAGTGRSQRRVPAKMCLHLPLQAGDLLVQGGDHRGQGPDGGGVGGGQGGRLAQLRAAQRGQDRISPLGEIGTSPGSSACPAPRQTAMPGNAAAEPTATAQQ
jgi:hypothetical protein